MASAKRWAFYESLKIGTLFTTAGGTLYKKLTETQAQRVQTGTYQDFKPNSICFLD